MGRFKSGIVNLRSALDTVKLLRGVKFSWRRDEFPHKKFASGKHSGFIAQEVEELIPDAVTTGTDGYKSLRMSYIIPYLVEALKEQDAALAGQDERMKEALKGHEATIAEQAKRIESLAEQSARLQRQGAVQHTRIAALEEA